MVKPLSVKAISYSVMWGRRRLTTDVGRRSTHVPLSSLIPLLRNLRDRVFRTGGVQPENLNSVGATHLHLQSAADRRKFQMFLRGSDGGDDAQSDLTHVRTIPGRFDRADRARNHGRVPPVELGASEKTF